MAGAGGPGAAGLVGRINALGGCFKAQPRRVEHRRGLNDFEEGEQALDEARGNRRAAIDQPGPGQDHLRPAKGLTEIVGRQADAPLDRGQAELASHGAGHPGPAGFRRPCAFVQAAENDAVDAGQDGPRSRRGSAPGGDRGRANAGSRPAPRGRAARKRSAAAAGVRQAFGGGCDPPRGRHSDRARSAPAPIR